jgi:hypothetical protein
MVPFPSRLGDPAEYGQLVQACIGIGLTLVGWVLKVSWQYILGHFKKDENRFFESYRRRSRTKLPS